MRKFLSTKRGIIKMKFMIKKFLRWIAGIPQPTLDFPPNYQNRPYVEGISWSVCKIVDDGFKWVDVLRKVEMGMMENPGELSPFLRGAWNGLCLFRYGRRDRNIEPIPENRTTAPFRSNSGTSPATNYSIITQTNHGQP